MKWGGDGRIGFARGAAYRWTLARRAGRGRTPFGRKSARLRGGYQGSRSYGGTTGGIWRAMVALRLGRGAGSDVVNLSPRDEGFNSAEAPTCLYAAIKHPQSEGCERIARTAYDFLSLCVGCCLLGLWHWGLAGGLWERRRR
jgi:hypothetical protein